MSIRNALTALVALLLSLPLAADWRIETPRPGITVLCNENGTWEGVRARSLGCVTTPWSRCRKVFDLSQLPSETLAQAANAVLRLHLGIVDYSLYKANTDANGLSENFCISFNGHELELSCADVRFPSQGYAAGGAGDANSTGAGLKGQIAKRLQDWANVAFPVDWLKDSEDNTLTVEVYKKAHDGQDKDDFVYVSIDLTVPNSQSAFTLDKGKTWKPPSSVEGQGEYMMRLILTDALAASQASILSDGTQLNDPSGFFGFQESDGTNLYLEFNTSLADASTTLEIKAPADAKFFDNLDNQLEATANDGVFRFAPGAFPFSLKLASPQPQQVSCSYTPNLTPPDAPVNLTPAIAPPRGKRTAREPQCTLDDNTATIATTGLTAVFQLRPTLRLLELNCVDADCNLVTETEATAFCRWKIGDKVYDFRRAKVTDVAPVAQGFRVTLRHEDSQVDGELTVMGVDDEIELAVRLWNRAPETQGIMPAFPQFGGLQLADDDYYLFPWGGGQLSDKNAALRSVYGTDNCQYQMMDIFSPSLGGGFYLRVVDPKAIYKAFALRKGKDVIAKYSLVHGYTPGRDPAKQFTDALEPREGIGLAVDYQEFARGKDEVLELPSVRLGSHTGDWHAPMRRYADWSLQTWPPRPVSEKLRTRWNLHGGIGHTQNTIAYSREWIMPSHEGQVIEFDSYWTLSDKAPWNTPWEESDAYYAERGQKPARRLHDPVTGKSLYAFNRGDYDGYNPQWGGLPAFRDLIDELRARDYVLTLYTDPIIACHNTKNGPELARKYGIINPDWRTFHHAANEPKPPIVHAYNSYCLDLNAEGYPEWIASTMGRLIRDTGADGIRLDEYGHRGYICFSDKHRHLFGEPGQNCWLTAVKHSIELVRAEFDKIDPTLIIMTEFPGHDAVASTLDGALSYNICRRYGTACPLPFNLFRQYFPNCKLYEINVQGPKNFYDLSIWNGAGTCYPIYPVPYLKLLSDHSDEFSGQAEMLVPTLKAGIYANKFTDLKTGKCVYTLYNHSGFTCHAPVLPAKPGCTYTCRDVNRNEPIPVIDGLLKVRIAPGRVVLICEQPTKQ